MKTLLGRSIALGASALSVVVLAAVAWPSPARAASIDQSFTSPTNLGAAINECCRFVAQTFTAGQTGTLAGVNVDVEGFRSTHLRVAIRAVESGAPTAVVLGEAVLDSNSAPLSRLITFPEQIQVIAGRQYAIVVSYDGAPDPGAGQAQGGWGGATDNPYSGGQLFFSFLDGISWFGEADSDLHFQTYVADAAAPPVLSIPGDITANATGPSGTPVDYVVRATDDTDPAPIVTCDRASGSTFPIGTTTVHCTATDRDGNTASASFNIHVKGANEQLEDLLNEVITENVGPGTGLAAKLEAARYSLREDNGRIATCRILDAFVNEARAQSGKALTSEQATQLVGVATRIQAVLGC